MATQRIRIKLGEILFYLLTHSSKTWTVVVTGVFYGRVGAFGHSHIPTGRASCLCCPVGNMPYKRFSLALILFLSLTHTQWKTTSETCPTSCAVLWSCWWFSLGNCYHVLCQKKKFFLISFTKLRPCRSFSLSWNFKLVRTLVLVIYLKLASFPLSLEVVCYCKLSSGTCSFWMGLFSKALLSASRFLSGEDFSWTSYKVCFCLDWICPIFLWKWLFESVA